MANYFARLCIMTIIKTMLTTNESTQTPSKNKLQILVSNMCATIPCEPWAYSRRRGVGWGELISIHNKWRQLQQPLISRGGIIFGN